MMKFVLLAFFLVSTSYAYVPTVESMFRHGSNADVSANGISITMIVKKIQPGDRPASSSASDVTLLKDEKIEDYFKVFFTKAAHGDLLKIAQTRYNNGTFSESSLAHKTYYPNFTPYSIKPTVEQMEKGLFYGVLQSLVLNDGSDIVSYLKTLGIPVRLNTEILNREKVEFLANYKRYLVTINKDRSLRKTELNPMKPDDAAARERVEEIMNEPMYLDMKQVKLSRDDGQVAWMVNAGPFEAVVSYKKRELQKIKYRSAAGDIEMICKDYWLADGVHSLPRFILVKGLSGQTYQVEITNLRHYNEKEEDLVKRLNRWDQALKGKESSELRPEFLL